MKHLYVTLYYSRFKLIPIRVIWTKLIIVKSLILIIIYIYFFLCMGLRVDVYVSTSITLHYHICFLPCMILWLINFHHHWISLLSTPWSKFSTVLPAYVHTIKYIFYCFICICHLIWFIFCFKIKASLSFLIELVYVSLMSKPCKWTP